MPAHRENSVLARHPASVVTDCDQRRAAAENLDADRVRARVEGIFDQLLDRRGGPFDNLAGRNLARDLLGQYVDYVLGHGEHESIISWRANSWAVRREMELGRT